MKTINHFLTFFILICITWQVKGQATQNELLFHDDNYKSLRHFVVMQITREEADSIFFKEPYAFSATVNLQLDMQGKITALSFVERSSSKEFDELMKKIFSRTSGKWSVPKSYEKIGYLNVVIPFRQNVRLNEGWKGEDLQEEYKTLHQNLKTRNVAECKKKNCIILPELSNSVMGGHH